MNKIEQLYQKKMMELKLVEEKVCTEEECEKYLSVVENGGELPEGIRRSTENPNLFLQTEKNNLTPEEIDKILLIYLFDNIATIKKCVVFLTIVVALLLAASIIMGISISNIFTL